MKKFIALLLFLPLIAFANTSCNTLAEEINTLIAKRMPNANVGISILNADNGKLLYEYQGYDAFSPASNMKLFTAAAALYLLGPDYRYHTYLALDKKQISHHTLTGNVYLYFSGDPSLTLKQLQQLIATLKQAGINEIKGNFVLDQNRFSQPDYAPGVSYDDIHWYYTAPISAIIVNQNSLYFQIRPSQTLGQPARVFGSPNVRKYATLAPAHVKTVTYTQAMQNCSLFVDVDNDNVFHLSGCWPITGHPKGLKLAIRNPFLFASRIIRDSLKTNQISLSGQILDGKMPNGLNQISEYHSPPLKQLLVTMMKDSNNIYAESLTKTLGAFISQTGSFQLGVNAMENILSDKTGIDFKYTTLADGAGASRYDLVTPMQITRLLYILNQDKHLRSLYTSALPDAGANGTLRHRMESLDMKNAVAAKTGSMKGISALSGYLRTLNNDTVIFSIMVNHITDDSLAQARHFEDDLLTILRRST